ncbi:protein FAR1-RELATED SEQUENCE 5-like [Sesbania bispinosa]|nr:protein FAR1-RELATED SEQUENCE 5-like [Sesbania bispinosa]
MKGSLTDETRKIVNGHLENGLKSLEGMLKNIKLGDTFSSKRTHVDEETSDEEKDEHNKSNSRKVLDPQHVQAKGTTDARLKSQLEKKRRKRNIPQAYSISQGAYHANKG